MSILTVLIYITEPCVEPNESTLAELKQKAVSVAQIAQKLTALKNGCPTDALTELFTVWDHFPIHHFRSNNKPIIAIGHKTETQLVTRKLLHPNYLKRALYYQELLKKGHVQSQRALAKHVGISQPKIHLILQMLKLDEEIKDFILKLDDSDPGLNFLTVYRLQPLFRVESKEKQRRKFWKMIEGQYPGQVPAMRGAYYQDLDS